MIFNASASAVVSQSPYYVRTSNTLPQVSVPTAQNALDKGYKTVVTAVSDYGPGVDAETSFVKAFTEGGGEVLESIRMPHLPGLGAILSTKKAVPSWKNSGRRW